MITIKGYTIANDEKWERAIHGTVGRAGETYGGVGEEASDEDKLAAYDKLGGLILKNGNKVKTGSFYDFKKRQTIKNPEVKLVFRDLEGNEVELGENEEKPIEIVAAEKIQEKKNKEESKKNKKNKKSDDEE